MTENINENVNEDIRIPSYTQHGWMKAPESLKAHFNSVRFGIFDVIPPLFNWNKTEKILNLTFKWSTDISDHEAPINAKGEIENCWIPSLRSLKYFRPPREFNIFVREHYPGLCKQQQPEHDWNDNGTVITLNLSWDLEKYMKE